MGARVLAGGLVCFAILAVSRDALALPMFARRYNVSCTECHAAVPRLNQTGFRFRAAGYRMPGEIGKDLAEPKFENYNAFRAVTQLSFLDTIDHDADTKQTAAQVDFVEAAVHPITGAWGSHLGTGGEFTIQKDGSVEIEQAQARYVFGDEDSHGSIRGGIFHGFEGYGAADRPLGLTRPLIQTAANSQGTVKTFFSPSDPSTAGLTGEYDLGDTSLSFNLLNRLGPKVSDGEVELKYLSAQSNRMGDVLLSLTHLYDLHGAGSGVTLYYYHGQSLLPTDADAFGAAGSGDTYRNNFTRLAAYANYYLTPEWNVEGGVASGRDQLPTADDLKSFGYFVELERFWKSSDVAAGARFDQFRPDQSVTAGTQVSASAFVNWLPIHQLQLVTEYRYLRTNQGLLQPLDVHSLIAQAMFLF